ncbi:MAG TPA: sulfotransferase domain-containing protein [Anaerolineales bacterium]|nr:sulfotransferase domain-containing protein [Anaerolineales bacterium]
MIVLSVGMPRAGSGWYYNLTNDLCLAAGFADARQIRRQYRLQNILTEVNCNIGALTPRRLALVMIPALRGHDFVIKAHAGPSPLARRLIRWGWIKPLYIYRDPRDALLSAFERGQKGLQSGKPNSFSFLIDFPTAVNFMEDYIAISNQWLALPQALHTRYEDFLNAYDEEAQRVVRFLDLSLADPQVQTIINRYQPEAATSDQRGVHFNKGRIGRFREKFTPEQQAVMAERFQDYLAQMNYPE